MAFVQFMSAVAVGPARVRVRNDELIFNQKATEVIISAGVVRVKAYWDAATTRIGLEPTTATDITGFAVEMRDGAAVIKARPIRRVVGVGETLKLPINFDSGEGKYIIDLP